MSSAPRVRRFAVARENPFWRLEQRRQARRGEALGWLGPLLVGLPGLALALAAGRGVEFPWPLTFWRLVLGYQATAVAAVTALAAWRTMADVLHPDNAVALRLTRLEPLGLVRAKLSRPALTAARTILLCLPVTLALGLLADRPGPPLSGFVGVLALVAVYALCLAAAAGAAAHRGRQATVDDWTDFIFNVRTLATGFLNPAWVGLFCLALLWDGPDLAEWLGHRRVWFGRPLTPWVLVLPWGCWLWRQMAGLAGEAMGERPALARQVVATATLAFGGLALVCVGFAWERSVSGGGLAREWGLPATPATTAALLLALLATAGWFLTFFAVYADALASGFRAASKDGDEPAPRPAVAVGRALLAGLAGGLIPVVVWWLCLALGGWSPMVAGAAYLGRALRLWVGCVGLSTAYLALLLAASWFPRARRETVALAVILPPLLGPFVLSWSHPLGHLLTLLTPLASLLWLYPDAGTGLTDTYVGQFTLATGWPTIATGQLLLTPVLLAIAAWLLRWARADDGPRRATGPRWQAIGNPLQALDLLILRRRGWLFSPLVMAVLPPLALAYMRFNEALEESVALACSAFLWPRLVSPGEPGEAVLAVILATIGAQLVIHPAGLAGVRCFARDGVSGRLDNLWLTSLSTRELVLARYRSTLAPFLIFLAVTALPVLVIGALLGQPLVALGGLAHWLALILLVPALVLAGTIRTDFRGQGLPTVALLEVGRLSLAAPLVGRLATDWGILLSNGLTLLVALGLTRLALGRATIRLAELRGGG